MPTDKKRSLAGRKGWAGRRRPRSIIGACHEITSALNHILAEYEPEDARQYEYYQAIMDALGEIADLSGDTILEEEVRELRDYYE